MKWDIDLNALRRKNRIFAKPPKPAIELSSVDFVESVRSTKGNVQVGVLIAKTKDWTQLILNICLALENCLKPSSTSTVCPYLVEHQQMYNIFMMLDIIESYVSVDVQYCHAISYN